MKRLAVIFLVLVLHVAAAMPTLSAIRQVEGVKDPAKRGDAGELGYHRITPEVWAQHTTAPFIWAGTDEALELYVAQVHLDWLERGLVARHGPHVSPYWLALAWNAGLTAALRGETTAEQRDYARRVQNLCQE